MSIGRESLEVFGASERLNNVNARGSSVVRKQCEKLVAVRVQPVKVVIIVDDLDEACTGARAKFNF